MKKVLSVLLCCSYITSQAQTPYPTAPASVGNITAIEYFLDNNNLAFGSGTALTGFTPSANVGAYSSAVNVTGVPSGFHRVYFRGKDANGLWSQTNHKVFDNYNVPIYAVAPTAATNIVQVEYYIDNNDLGFGNCTPIAITPNTNIANFNANINITGLAQGAHLLFIRCKDATGKWSLTNISYFSNAFSQPYHGAPSAATNIVQMEYFIDNNDLGFGNCTPISITPNTNIANFNANINVASLAQGAHLLFIRSKDATGKWSLTNISYFSNAFSQTYPGAPAAATNIVQIEYFIDNNDLGFGNCTQIAITPNTNIANFSTNVNVASLAQGSHRLFIRSKNAIGKWSLTNLSIFDNTTAQAYPTAPATAPAVNQLEYFIDTDPGFGLATPLTVPGNTGNISNYAVSLNLSGTLSVGTHYLHIRSKQNPYSLTQVVPFTATGVVPLTWQFIKAQLQNTDGVITWGTAQEINTQLFIVEHSNDGINFKQLATQPAAGNSSSVSSYTYTHKNISTGLHYYRIIQIDVDGKFTYSPIVILLNKDNLKQAFIAPNPVASMLNLIEPKNIFINSVAIYDSKGSMLLRKNINSEVQVYSLPVSNLPNGNYVLKVRYKNGEKNIAFIK